MVVVEVVEGIVVVVGLVVVVVVVVGVEVVSVVISVIGESVGTGGGTVIGRTEHVTILNIKKRSTISISISIARSTRTAFSNVSNFIDHEISILHTWLPLGNNVELKKRLLK